MSCLKAIEKLANYTYMPTNMYIDVKTIYKSSLKAFYVFVRSLTFLAAPSTKTKTESQSFEKHASMQNKVLGRISLTDLFSYSLIHSLGHVKCLISLVVAPSFVFRCVIISISDLSPHFCTAFLTPNVRHTCCTPQPLQVFSKLFRIVTFRRTKQHEI